MIPCNPSFRDLGGILGINSPLNYTIYQWDDSVIIACRSRPDWCDNKGYLQIKLKISARTQNIHPFAKLIPLKEGEEHIENKEWTQDSQGLNLNEQWDWKVVVELETLMRLIVDLMGNYEGNSELSASREHFIKHFIERCAKISDGSIV